jgi:hypothetical protein
MTCFDRRSKNLAHNPLCAIALHGIADRFTTGNNSKPTKA